MREKILSTAMINIKNKYPDGEVGIVYPILSRNRFSLILKGIARGCKKIYMLLRRT